SRNIVFDRIDIATGDSYFISKMLVANNTVSSDINIGTGGGSSGANTIINSAITENLCSDINIFENLLASANTAFRRNTVSNNNCDAIRFLQGMDGTILAADVDLDNCVF